MNHKRRNGIRSSLWPPKDYEWRLFKVVNLKPDTKRHHNLVRGPEVYKRRKTYGVGCSRKFLRVEVIEGNLYSTEGPHHAVGKTGRKGEGKVWTDKSKSVPGPYTLINKTDVNTLYEKERRPEKGKTGERVKDLMTDGGWGWGLIDEPFEGEHHSWTEFPGGRQDLVV